MRPLLLSLPQHADYSSNPQVKEAAHALCKKFLANQWSKAASDKIKLKQITGGTSNLLFLVTVDHPENVKHAPNQVLIRINFSPDGANHWLTESVIFSQLSEQQIGPRLYGVFDQGRLEEYIPSRPLTTLELFDQDYSKEIACKLARIHKINAPIEKEPSFLMDCIDRWFQGYLNVLKTNDKDVHIAIPEKNDNIPSRVLGEKELVDEIEFIRSSLPKTKSKVLFCHNDLQENNILHLNTPQTENERLIFIDFEYSCYNYRGHDIANHFNEHVINYTNPEYPFFEIYHDTEIHEKHMMTFCRNYLREYDHKEPSDDEVRSLVKETLPFMPISDFFWAIWSLYMGETSPISFGYGVYAQDRLASYFKNRHHLTALV